jgi:hypothetical protein
MRAGLGLEPSQRSSIFGELPEGPQTSELPNRQSAAQAEIYLAGANLVIEEETEPVPPPLLVKATPVRRQRQLAIFAVVVVAVALLVGLSVGLAANRPTSPTPAPTAEQPTLSPTPYINHLLWSSLPQYTYDAIRDTSSPQFLASEWATEVDQVPWLEAPNDEILRVEQLKQRFTLATFYYATDGNGSWDYSGGWLNSTLHDCRWSFCCCGANCRPDDDGSTIGGDPQGELSLPFYGTRQQSEVSLAA